MRCGRHKARWERICGDISAQRCKRTQTRPGQSRAQRRCLTLRRLRRARGSTEGHAAVQTLGVSWRKCCTTGREKCILACIHALAAVKARHWKVKNKMCVYHKKETASVVFSLRVLNFSWANKQTVTRSQQPDSLLHIKCLVLSALMSRVSLKDLSAGVE